MTEDRKPRILSIMLGRGAGGLESVLIDHATAFDQMGYYSSILCHQKSWVLPRLKAQDKIKFHTIPSSSLYNPVAWVALAKVIREERPDILCLHGNRAISFCTSPILKALVHPFPKVMATTHNNRNKLFHRLDGIFSISQFLTDGLIHDFHIDANKIFACPNMAPLPKDIPQYKEKTPLRIGFLRRLEIDKGGDVLLNACKILKDKKVPFHVVMAGDGSKRTEYQEFVNKNGLSDNISFIGWVSDKAKFFSQVDIVCIPSRAEGQPLALLESMSYGKPAVVSTCPGMLEAISPLSAGLSFPIGDANALADRLTTLIQDPKLRADLAERSRQTYFKFYTPTAQKKNLAHGIESLMHQSHHTR
ncbi:MAG: glycosyltransferase [Alphaproteobacteria bacterium]|nr:glycosyltransferase [Alphaproteobacteria bacterium]